MKLFLSIGIQNLFFKKDQFAKLKIGLKNKDIEHRFEPVDQMHITLVDLGDVSMETYEEKEGYINNIIQRQSSFELKLQGVFAYPEPREGRLLWINVQNTRELKALQADLSHQISSFCELIYKPILPIVRLRNHKNVTDIISPYKAANFGKLLVESVILFEMISGGAFPIFKPLKTYYLNRDLEDSYLVG